MASNRKGKDRGGAPEKGALGRTRMNGWLLALIIAVVALVFGFRLYIQLRGEGDHPADASGRQDKMESDQVVFARYGGSASCGECHSEEFKSWAGSNHGLAERPIDAVRDRAAFEPPRSFR